MKTITVKASNTRQKFKCDSNDKIMFNGSCYQLITKSFYKDWSDVTPVISKTEFERIVKLNIISEPYEKIGFGGMKVTYYDFQVKE